MLVFESLLRVAMVAGSVWIVWALWASRPRLASCLGCGVELQRADVVHCSDCLGV